jgi:hypothetical protein
MIEESIFDKRLLNLNSSSYLGYYHRYNLPDIIQSVSAQEGVPITVDPSRWNFETVGYSDIQKLWKEANFNSAAIKWINYYPETHFDKELTTDIAFYLRLTTVHRSWISRIDPGFYAPWHWDVDENEQEYLKSGEIKRYTVMLGPPAMGHIFILGNDYLYNTPIGSIFKWKNYKEWHAGTNAGLTPNYMFHILGS